MKTSRKLKINIVLLFINVVSLVIATYSWFVITKPKAEVPEIRIFAGDYTYVSLDPETGYKPTLDFQDDIVGGIYETGQHLIPVTSVDGITFYKKYGSNYSHPADAEARSFFEFDLFLKSSVDRNLYLGEGSGFEATVVNHVAYSIRVSYTSYTDDENRIVENSYIWEPTNPGAGSYGEGIYDVNYPDIDDPDFICYTPTNPAGYLLCPTAAQKATYAANSYSDAEMAIPVRPPATPEDLTGIPVLLSITGGAAIGRMLTIRIWIEGFDPDNYNILTLGSENVELKIDFVMNLYFAGREVWVYENEI